MPGQTTVWLNSLSAEELREVRDIWLRWLEIDRPGSLSSAVTVTGGECPVTLSCLPGNQPRTGAWYVSWATCSVATYLGSQHPRWQPTIVKPGTTSTPLAEGNAHSLKDKLAPQKWGRLKNLASTNGQVKIPLHHLAFRFQNPGVQLPANLGHGASISHLCDRHGCVRPEHLELTIQHANNLERQRCMGVALVVGADVIIHEVPCPHGVGLTSEARINSSCRKLRMIWLPSASLDHLFKVHEDMLSALNLPFSQ
jgi:hypothetical protein